MAETKAETYCCRTCGREEQGQQAITAHVRSAHNREPDNSPLRKGDLIKHDGNTCKILKVYPDGRLFVQPLLTITVEYRIDAKAWALMSDAEQSKFAAQP